MNVFVIGATGMAGSAIVKEARRQGLEVIANGRNLDKLKEIKGDDQGINILQKDAFQLTEKDLQQADSIIDAFAIEPDQAYRQVDLAAKLVALLRDQKTRVGFILGAGSLYADDSKTSLVYDAIKADDSSKPWRAIPENQLYELDFLKNVHNVNWFGISPAISFLPGEKSEKILYGTDVVLTNDAGKSETTAGTMAVAVVAELLKPEHQQSRFTVANG
ncbi:NAD(P)H-binding protein [Fructobacillus sp. M1-13]|uniref:NAD(P)H-binding protein n=1 Tax=Fructobacillus papyriferae TaxID=2713171 RepID=A0ABS5QSR4_9LACO|nr:NAD-dependent epimerase/dehydratase family protein [Fructobacillus papyriferae]MBS9335354.1 NAD(P)H-binding protein [Fructobacillus papyriferae]MCD2158977.1 NAD(P)H-binding protein [Fructobacillus papyriferae]